MHGALAPAAMGLEAWPQVSVQIHYAKDDPLVDVDQVRALEAAAQHPVPLPRFMSTLASATSSRMGGCPDTTEWPRS
jgi:hypothetical protein